MTNTQLLVKASHAQLKVSTLTLTISKHEIVVDRVHEITVVIEGGMCVDVRGLPEEWEYAIEDYDMEKQG